MNAQQRAEIEERIALLRDRAEFADPIEESVDRAAAAELVRLLRRFEEIERKEKQHDRHALVQ